MLEDLKVNLQVTRYRFLKALRRVGCLLGHHPPFRIAFDPLTKTRHGWECSCRYLWYASRDAYYKAKNDP